MWQDLSCKSAVNTKPPWSLNKGMQCIRFTFESLLFNPRWSQSHVSLQSSLITWLHNTFEKLLLLSVLRTHLLGSEMEWAWKGSPANGQPDRGPFMQEKGCDCVFWWVRHTRREDEWASCNKPVNMGKAGGSWPAFSLNVISFQWSVSSSSKLKRHPCWQSKLPSGQDSPCFSGMWNVFFPLS